MNGKKKLRVGWFSFSCSEDSTIMFTELLNDHYKEWKHLGEFKYFLPLQKREDFSEIDVAFIEGAIASLAQEKKVKQIRNLAKKVVAIGSCACIGMPSSQRNLFDEKTREEISQVMLRFSYADKVKKVSDVVPVDDMVNGCPMDTKVFLQVLTKYLHEFGVA